MPATRRRRIIRLAVIELAVVVLLAGYVGSYVGTAWLVGRGHMKNSLRLDHTLYAPVALWVSHDLPGTDALLQLRNQAYWAGRGAPDPMTTPWGAGDL